MSYEKNAIVFLLLFLCVVISLFQCSPFRDLQKKHTPKIKVSLDFTHISFCISRTKFIDYITKEFDNNVPPNYDNGK